MPVRPSPAWRRHAVLPAVVVAVGLGAYGALGLLGDGAPEVAPVVAAPALAPIVVEQVAPAVAAAAVAAPAVVDPRPVAGTLIDRGGRPIAGARVDVLDAAGAALDAVSITDADGGFHFEPAALAKADRLRLGGTTVAAAEVSWLAAGPAPRVIATRLVVLQARVGLPGAVVHVRAGGTADVATAIVGPDGVARLAPLAAAPYELWAEASGQASMLIRVDAAAADADVGLTLAAAGRVVGQLRGPGAGRAVVTLTSTIADAAAREVTADVDGRFAVDAVVPGTWQLVVDGIGGFDEQALTISAGATADVQATLRPTGRLVGAVVDDLGAPVAGATVIVQGTSIAMPTSAASTGWVHPLTGDRQMPMRDSRRFGADRPGPRPAECGAGHCGVDLGTERGKIVHAVADGTVALVYPQVRGRAGRYVALDHAGGLRTFYMHLDEVRGDLQVGAPIAAGEPLGTVGTTGVHVSGPHLHFALAQVQDGRSWYLDPEVLLLGAVVMPADRALGSTVIIDDGVRVATLRSDGGRVAPTAMATATQGTSDARGAFAVGQLRPGTYSALVVAPGLIMGRSVQVTIAAGADSAPVRVTLSAGVTIEGVVSGPDGPVRGARVTAVAADVEGSSGEVVQQLAAAVTGADGRYQLRAVTGAVTLAVSAPGFATSQRDVVLGRADLARRTRQEDLTLVDARSRLHGEVRDDDGAPLGGVVVRVTRGPTADRRAVTAPDGSFRIAGVVDGSYQLELVVPGRAPQPAALRSEAFTTLVVSQGATLEIAVADRHTGRMLAATVRASGPGNATQTLTCDAAGIATAAHLAAGRWSLEINAAGFVTERRTVEVAGRRPAPVRVELGRGALIAGVVRDAYGQRVAGARVRLGTAEGTTNGNGEFRLRDAPTGDLELQVELGDQRVTQPLTLAPGDERVTLVIDLP